MTALVELLLLGLPLLLLPLLAGLALIIAVLANEGRGKSSNASQIVGVINLLLIVPLSLLSWAAEARDIRFMFMFAAGVFALLGLLGVRVPRRFRD